MLQSYRKCGPGVSKGAALIAGAINSAPLGRILLVLFLAKQEKYISARSILLKGILSCNNTMKSPALLPGTIA